MVVKVAVIGVGKIGIRHIEAYKNLEGAEVVAIGNSNPELLSQMGKRYNIKTYLNFKDILKHDGVDVVDICTPTKLHHKMIIQALDKNKHVFCEKPLTYKSRYAEMIKKKQEETERIVMVGYLYRFHPTLRRLKRILEDKVIGDPYYAWFRIGGRGGWRVWKHNTSAGGAIIDMMTHMLDLVDWYFGETETAKALSREVVLKERLVENTNINVNVEDFSILQLKNNGVRVFCQADLITPSFMNTIEVHGTNGSFFGSILSYLPVMVYCKERHGLYDQGKNIFENKYVNLVEKELEYFLEVLGGVEKSFDNIDSAIRVLKVIEGIKRGTYKR